MKNKIYSVKELESIKLFEMIQNKLTSTQILSLQKDIDRKNKFLIKKLGLRINPISLNYTNGDYYLKFSGISGVIKLSNLDIEIIPKFVINNQDLWRKSFLSMINISKSKHILLEKNHNLKFENLNFYDHLALSFIDSLSCISSDCIHTYSTVIKNSHFLKGRLLLGEQISNLLSNPGVFICEYDIFDSENEFNYLLLWTLNQLNSKCKNRSIKSSLYELEQLIPKVNNKYSIPVLTPLPPQYVNFKEAIDIGNALASGSSLSHSQGNNTGYGYLVNMEKTYELFIENILNLLVRNIDSWKIKPQLGKVFATAISTGQNDFYTVPDNVLFVDGSPSILVDAKYKNSLNITKNKRPVNSDIYQMFSSLIAHNCNKALLINPRSNVFDDSSDDFSLWSIDYNNEKFFIASLSLNISSLHSSKDINNIISCIKKNLDNLLNLK